MAFAERLVSDYLNQNGDPAEAAEALLSVTDDAVVMTCRGEVCRGRAEVLAGLDRLRRELASEGAASAGPVITEDAAGRRGRAVALFRGGEEAFLLLRVRSSEATWLIVGLDSEGPDGYGLFHDLS